MTTRPLSDEIFAAWMKDALSRGIEQAFGGVADVVSVTPGPLADLVDALGPGHRVHLELDAGVAGTQRRNLLAVFSAVDVIRLFDLEPIDEASIDDPETQLRLLAELTEGGEALAGALPHGGLPTALTVAGASLEAAEGSVAAAISMLGDDTIAVRIELGRPTGDSVSVVLATTAEMATALTEEPGNPAFEADASTVPSAGINAGPTPIPVSPMPSEPAVVAHPFTYSQLGAPAPAAPRQERNFDPILDVSLKVRVELGSTRMTVEEVLAVTPGSIIELDRLAGEPVDIVINDRLIARGEVVVVEENFGVRVTEIITQRARTAAVA